MKPYQYFLLTLTLIFFLLSLVGHFTLEAPVCCCLAENDGEQGNICDKSDADVCLVCQLQMGIYYQAIPSCMSAEIIAVPNSDSSSSVEFVSQVFRPPILL
jgi:hypothetical protein